MQKRVHEEVQQTKSRSGWPVKDTLAALGIASRSYYRWLKEEAWAKVLVLRYFAEGKTLENKEFLRIQPLSRSRFYPSSEGEASHFPGNSAILPLKIAHHQKAKVRPVEPSKPVSPYEALSEEKQSVLVYARKHAKLRHRELA